MSAHAHPHRRVSAPLQQILDRAIVDACCELFEGRGVCLGFVGRSTATVSTYDGIASVIGFAGPSLRGSMALYMSAGIVRISHPTLRLRDHDDEEHSLRDWAGELANQTLGRIKNKLAKYAMTFSLGIPTAISGRELTVVHLGTTEPDLYRFCAIEHEMHLVWAAEFAPDLDYTEHDDDSSRGLEGELIEF